MRPESTATKWGAYAGIITFLLLVPLAITNSDQATWGTIGILAVAPSITVTLIAKWWEREWNTKIANAEQKKADIEEKRLSIEFISAIASNFAFV